MISPTTKDLTRSIDFLDTHASGHPDFTDHEMIVSVAKNIKFLLRNTGIGSKSITNKGVAMVLYTHGASPFMVQQFAGKIGRELRKGATSQL